MNKVIGEMKAKIGTKEFLLRPSFRGQAEIEDLAGEGIPSIAEKLIKGKVGVKLIAAIIYGGIVGALEPGEMPSISFEALGDMIVKHGYKNGFAKIAPQAVNFLARCMTGEDEKKDEAPTAEAEPKEK